MIDLLEWQGRLTQTTSEALKQLDSIRQQIVECDEECHWLHSAPLPLDDALDNIDRFIAKNNQVSGISQFFYDRKLLDRPFIVTTEPDKSSVLYVIDNVVTGTLSSEVDVSTIFCGLFPELVKTALVERVTREFENIEAGPPRAERAGLISAAKQRRYALEVEEEALISHAEDTGLAGFYRRSDCNPEIVLMRGE